MKNAHKDYELKKNNEFARLNSFRKLCNFFPNGKIDEDHKEEPDFLIRSNDRIFGIEITDLHWRCNDQSKSPQANESIRHKITELVRQEYDSRELPKVEAFINFNPGFVPTDKNNSLSRAQKTEFAHCLVDLIKKKFDSNGTTYFEENCFKHNALRQIINNISVNPLSALSQSHFSHAESSFVPLMNELDISLKFEKKENKIIKYRNKCDEIWLIIFWGFDTISTEFQPNPTINENIFQSSFDRAFLLHRCSELKELKLRCTDK